MKRHKSLSVWLAAGITVGCLLLECNTSSVHPDPRSASAEKRCCDAETHNDQEETMTPRSTGLMLAAMLLASSAAFAQAPSWSPPPDNARCPSKWGASDERGSANHMKPQSVLNAVKLIKTGEVIELGHVLNESIPIQRTRRFEMFTKPTGPALGSNNRRSNEELVVAEIGQVGTQFDGFAHQTHGNSVYTCFKLDDIMTRTGFTKLGIHQVGALITRGVLIDVAGYKGVEMLGDTYEITVADLEGALKKQNTTLQAGDAILVNTGWHKHYAKDNPRYVKSCPGLG